MMGLSKQKRDRFILVILVTAVILVALGFGLIRGQYDSLRNLADKQRVTQKQLSAIEEAFKNADRIEARLKEANKSLARTEETMASGDYFSSMINLIKKFSASYKVDIPQFGQPIVAEVSLLPRFPYKQVSLSVTGTGYFHDIGKFIADFENRYPQIRFQNLTLEPGSALLPGENEKLSFKMEVVTLIKPGA